MIRIILYNIFIWHFIGIKAQTPKFPLLEEPDSGAHTASSAMGTGVSFPGDKAAEARGWRLTI